MSRVIWRFDLKVDDIVEVDVPEGAYPLTVMDSDRAIMHMTSWWMVEPSRETKTQRLLVVGTGNPVPENIGEHVGSFRQGGFVWHVFKDASSG